MNDLTPRRLDPHGQSTGIEATLLFARNGNEQRGYPEDNQDQADDDQCAHRHMVAGQGCRVGEDFEVSAERTGMVNGQW